MSFPLTKRVATFSLAGMCALAMVAPVINAPSAQAAGHRFGISQTFWIRVDGRVTHQFSLIEQSNFISKEACESLPVALEWSRVTFSASPTSTRCTIETDFNRHVNPYVAVDQNRSVTFAARPIALEDLGLELPEDTTLTYQSVSLTGRGFHATQVTKGAETRQDSTGDNVSWKNIGKDVVAAEGTIDVDNDFHTQERKTYQGIEAVDMPGDLQDASATVKANASSSNSPSPSSKSARSSAGSSGMMSGLMQFIIRLLPAIVVFGGATFIARYSARRRRKNKYQSGGFPVRVPTPLPSHSTSGAPSQAPSPFSVRGKDLSASTFSTGSQAPSTSTPKSTVPADPHLAPADPRPAPSDSKPASASQTPASQIPTSPLPATSSEPYNPYAPAPDPASSLPAAASPAEAADSAPDPYSTDWRNSL